VKALRITRHGLLLVAILLQILIVWIWDKTEKPYLIVLFAVIASLYLLQLILYIIERRKYKQAYC
jgi:hypothetical protein